MSTSMNRLASIISLAKSNKVTDYKKAIKSLLEFWDDNSELAFNQITEYSKKSCMNDRFVAYSWNEIFLVVHELFVTEIDRIGKLTGNSGKLDKERITKLVYVTSDRANFYLKPKDVVISTLQVLQNRNDNIFSEFYEIYLSILRKYVLQERAQRILVNPVHWDELLDVCISKLEKNIVNVDYVKLLEIVELIVRYGCSLSNLLFASRKLLPVIGKLFENYESYRIRSTDVLFKLSFTVCQQIATDSRFIICRFAETIPLSMIDVKGPVEKYKLYLLFMQVHHPNGAILGDSISYAYDENKWKAILNLLYKMILNDLKSISLSNSFTALSCEVLQQRMHTKLPNLSESMNLHDSVYIQPRKKRRVSDEQEKLVELVNDRDPARAWPIIQIAIALYSKYPECLKIDEYIEFLDIIIKLLSQASKNFAIMENLFELTSILIRIESRYETDDLKSYWDKIWDAVLRYLSITHREVVQKAWILVQDLISYQKVSNPKSLLKLYLTQPIQGSSYSIETLKVFCENIVLPNEIEGFDINSSQLTNNSIKLQLLKWTLSKSNRLTSPSSMDEFSKLLIGFTLKSWYKSQDIFQTTNDIKYVDIFYSEMDTITTQDIERCYLTFNVKSNLPQNENIEVDVKVLDEKIVDNPYIAEDLDFLLNGLIQTVQIQQISDIDLSVLITNTSLIAKVISNLKSMKMIKCSFDEFCLVKELKICLSNIFDLIENMNWSKNIRYTLEITKTLVLLYQTKYDELVNEVILTSTNFSIVKKIYDITKIKRDEFDKDSKISQCKINAIMVMALYSCINAGEEVSELQLKIMSTLLKLEKYKLSNKTDVICVTNILEIFSNMPMPLITEASIELLMGFVTEMFQEWQKDDKVSRYLLQLLPKILDKVTYIKDIDNVHNLLLICKIFHDQFAKGSFGQLTHLALVQCLNKVIQHNILNNTEVDVLNQEVFITFVNSPYYLVRLESLKCIYSVFSLSKLDHGWKSDFYDKLLKAIYRIFLVQREFSDSEIQEERYLRSVSVMQILATVVCSKSIFQCAALFALLKITVDKDIDRDMVKDTITLINTSIGSSKNIIEENLNYLLTSWCGESTLENFPYVLLGSANEAHFYDHYVQIIFPVLMREGKIREARHICDKIGATFEDVFKACCSNIVPWTLTEEFAETLKQLMDNTGDFQGTGSYTSLIKEHLQEVIQQIVQGLHDVNDFYSTFDAAVSLPATDPPHFKRDIVDQCLDNLLRIISSDVKHSIFYLIITRKPSTFQKILLHLTCNVYACRISEYKAKALHQYVYFCSKIVEELKQKHCNSVSQYFIKDIGCTLLNLTKESDEFIAKLACKYLHTFFQNILPERSAEVGNFLSLCVKTLTPLVRNPNENSAPKAVLLFLLKEQKHCLADAMETLGSLPSFINTKSNQETESQILKENLEHFLNASDDESCSPDSLMDLHRQLSSRRCQLEELYEKLQSIQGFAEECAASLLHRLIYRLIRLTESRDIRVGLEAAKCLGVLGPADLATMILHPQETQRRESLGKADLLTHRICRLLADLLVSSNIELRRVSSEVLYLVFESPWGARVDLNNSEYGVTDAFLSNFLNPFRGKNTSTTSAKANLQVIETELKQVFDSDNPLWSQESNGPYQQWLSNITSAVANCFTGFYSKSLLPIFKLNVQFCEITLPRLVALLIDVKSSQADRVCHCINLFFEYHFWSDEMTTSSTQPQYIQNCTARDAIKCMLEVVNHLRIQSREEINLAFDYLPIAMAAQFCSAYFSSVLYAELWCLSNLNTPRDFDSIPMIDQIYEQDNKKGKIAQDILKEAYVKIGDSDSIYGCGSSHLQNRYSRVAYYTNFQKLDKLILSHDVELSKGNISARGLITALRESSLHYSVKCLLSSNSALSGQVDPMEDLCYDSLWRLSDWSQITSIKAHQTSKKVNDFSTYHYEALKSLHEYDNSSLEDSIKQAYLCVMKDLCNMSLESCKAVYPKLSQLQMLREIEELNSTDPEDYKILLSNWEEQKYIFNNNFQYIEPILSQRAVMFKIRDPIKSSSCIKNALIDAHLETARLAREQGHLNAAARALETLSKETNLDEGAENRLLYHEARLAWMRKDEDMARFNLRNIIKKQSVNPSLLARTLRVYGNWIAENKSENPQAIISKYYEKAIETYLLMPEISSDDVSDGSKARAALAQFAHEQYLMVTDYMKSPQFESLKECIDYSRNAVPKTVSMNDKDVYRAVSINSKQSSIDCLELENIHKDRDAYLALAVKNYLLTLQDSNKHDFLVFRLVSLWLDNMHDQQVNKFLEKDLKKIPSYKFIPLIPQLAPHLSNSGDVFSRKIGQVLERCAEEHPHHTLPVILALKNLYNDSKYCNKKITKAEPRVIGAQQLIQKLQSSNIRPIIQEMDLLSDALVMLAYHETDKKQGNASKCSIPRNAPLHQVKDFKHSIVPTLAIDIKKSGNYTNIVSVMKYDSSYSNVGGINAPKKVICLGSDGIHRPQLVKGKDDLRQDAVMQQVFTVMNSLLKSNKDAKQRKLHVRRYKVVPLTQRSGVLQWCENTLPLSIILTGDGTGRNPGLHRKYYPHDYAPNDCRKRLQAIKNAQQRYNGFMDCCKNLRPAFHHFFTENYLSPETWFERRLAYTRSVATTSIIGYILGLGDRHVSNILVDKSTAEVIHIDFGIAFEQGKLLPTPETVPFRLTRDMEAAMGVSGVEGTMRRCCEETMAVLRQQKEIIVTLLRVLLYDPLYSWAITPAKAATYQSEHSSRSSESKESNSPVGTTETNKLAERALLRVQQKLQGIEEGVASSIAGQVERLIQQARDPTNLSRLFVGWQAYL